MLVVSTTAKQLGIAGTSQELTVDGDTVQGLDGSRTIRIATTATTTVSELAEKINTLDSSGQREPDLVWKLAVFAWY